MAIRSVERRFASGYFMLGAFLFRDAFLPSSSQQSAADAPWSDRRPGLQGQAGGIGCLSRPVPSLNGCLRPEVRSTEDAGG